MLSEGHVTIKGKLPLLGAMGSNGIECRRPTLIDSPFCLESRSNKCIKQIALNMNS